MADSAAKKAWTAANTTRIVMNLNHNTDKDILEKLEAVPSKQGYIKDLIRADLKKTNHSVGMTRRQRSAYDAMKSIVKSDFEQIDQK